MKKYKKKYCMNYKMKKTFDKVPSEFEQLVTKFRNEYWWCSPLHPVFSSLKIHILENVLFAKWLFWKKF